jgi:DNA-binding MarR family transcriptional regulator
MHLFVLATTPATKFFSYIEFKKSHKANIKQYILSLLKAYSEGLTCREISQISGIEIQSLTAPIKDLENENNIRVKGIRLSAVSNRKVQVYSLVKV